MRLDIELPSFPHAVLYHPAVATSGVAAGSEPPAEPQISEPWIALQVFMPAPSLFCGLPAMGTSSIIVIVVGLAIS